MNKTFALVEVKAAETDDPNGAFEAILSVPTLDRDGEVIDAKAFDPLPASIPVHAFHDFSDPIGRGVPIYEGDSLYLRGVFASTPRAQEIRSLVAEGIVASMSVGFMGASRSEKDGVPHITRAELLEGSFVSVPSNREAAVLVAKQYAEGVATKATKGERLQAIHDLSVANGASCEGKHAEPDDTKSTDDPETSAAAPAAAEPPASLVDAKAIAVLAEAEALLA